MIQHGKIKFTIYRNEQEHMNTMRIFHNIFNFY